MTPAQFIANLRRTRDPNWSDVQHLLELVWSGEVGVTPPAAQNAIGNLSHAMQIADVLYADREDR